MSQIINVGTIPNDGTGDKLRDAFIIVNDNFASIDTLLSGSDVLTISQITGLQTALNNINNTKEMPIAAGVFLIPFILITTCCLVALVKIRSFLKETGMGDRVDTCKILLHSTIFILFTL